MQGFDVREFTSAFDVRHTMGPFARFRPIWPDDQVHDDVADDRPEPDVLAIERVACRALGLGHEV